MKIILFRFVFLIFLFSFLSSISGGILSWWHISIKTAKKVMGRGARAELLLFNTDQKESRDCSDFRIGERQKILDEAEHHHWTLWFNDWYMECRGCSRLEIWLVDSLNMRSLRIRKGFLRSIFPSKKSTVIHNSSFDPYYNRPFLRILRCSSLAMGLFPRFWWEVVRIICFLPG